MNLLHPNHFDNKIKHRHFFCFFHEPGGNTPYIAFLPQYCALLCLFALSLFVPGMLHNQAIDTAELYGWHSCCK